MMSVAKRYQVLAVRKRVLELAAMVYQASARFRAGEKVGTTSQVRRETVSVASTIAKGAGHRGSKGFLDFLGMASGSLAEMETILIPAQRPGRASPDQATPLHAFAAEVGRMLSGLQRAIDSPAWPRPAGHDLFARHS